MKQPNEIKKKNKQHTHRFHQVQKPEIDIFFLWILMFRILRWDSHGKTVIKVQRNEFFVVKRRLNLCFFASCSVSVHEC